MKEYQQYDNKNLLELLSKDDEFAFTEIYDRFWKKIFCIAYARINETQIAEDIVQDVFASLWTNRKKSEINSLDNYLASAAKYMVFAKIKKKARERIYNESLQVPVIEMQLDESLHFKKILEFVKLEVEKLPEKCKLIFNYSRVHGMSIKQIAEDLQISPKTVENQINKALKQLKFATRSFTNLF